jgi:competence protein ComEC
VDASGPGAVRVVEEGPALHGAGVAADLRAGLLDAVDGAYDGRGRALYAALLAGDPSGLDPRSVEAWRRTGTWHVLVVSGYHIAAAAVAAAWILGRAGAGPRARALGAAGTAAAYAAATGFGTPALRALVAVALVAFAPLLRRRADPFHALCVAAGVLLAHRPAVLSEPGFQLSFAAVLGLLRLSPAVGTLLFARRRFLRRFPVPAADRSLRRRLGDALERGLPAALGAWAATAPILVHQFGTFSPVTPLANLLIVPLSTALLGIGAALLPLGPVAPAIPRAAGEAAAVLLDALVLGLERLPGAWYAIPPPPAALLAVDAVALAAAALSPTPARLLAAAAALAALGSIPLAAPPRPPAPSCLVLDVGHGLAVLADGGAARVLGDAGGRGPRAGERSVLPALRARGALHLDALLISHEDQDHLSAAREVLESVRVGALVVPEGFGAGPWAVEVLASAAREGVPVIAVAAGDRLRLPGLEVEILHPVRGRGPPPTENGGSLVARVRMDGLSALLPGDVEGEALERLLRSGADLRADVLLLPHHGSPLAGDLATLAAATGARFLVASSGSATVRVDRVPSPTAPRFLATDEEGAILIGPAGVEEWR